MDPSGSLVHFENPDGTRGAYPAVEDSPEYNRLKRLRAGIGAAEPPLKRRSIMDSVGPFTVPAPDGSMPYDVKELWREINNRETAARKTRRQGRSLDAYQRAFFAVFPHYLPYHVEGCPIRLTFQERELWNRVKPASRKRMYRRYKPRRRPLRRVGLKRRTYRRRR